ncbi:MAG: DeoR/GlpR transcriptional regulator [Oscillospiraceae bacterium]|nr:DeoR/GlpR transcriptional regulator [Oscillospiraceae bacterium]
MLAHKRKELIKEMVSKYRIVRVSDLSERFQTSDVTIRRDLKELEEAGLLKRTHGGAIKVTNTAFDPALVDLETTQVAEKLQIAREAYKHINDNDAIVLDPSSTVAYLATLLKSGEKKNITLVTNSFKEVMELVDCPEVEVIHIGGQLRHKLQSAIGPIAEASLRNLKVDKAFIGCNGIDFQNGYTTTNLFEGQIKQAMMKSANQTYMLADSSKFHQTYLGVVAPINGVDYLITDSGVDAETIAQAEEAGINLIVAGQTSENE